MATDDYEAALRAVGFDPRESAAWIADWHARSAAITQAALEGQVNDVKEQLRHLHAKFTGLRCPQRRVAVSHQVWTHYFTCQSCGNTPRTLVRCSDRGRGHGFCYGYDCVADAAYFNEGAANECPDHDDRSVVIGVAAGAFRLLDVEEYQLWKSAIIECQQCDAYIPAAAMAGHCCPSDTVPEVGDADAGISSLVTVNTPLWGSCPTAEVNSRPNVTTTTADVNSGTGATHWPRDVTTDINNAVHQQQLAAKDAEIQRLNINIKQWAA